MSKDNIITYEFSNDASSNTFVVDKEEDTTILAKHPLAEGVLVRLDKNKVNTVPANVKDSIERALDFVKTNLSFLDFNAKADLEALSIYFVVTRQLSPKQKSRLATMCGKIAVFKLNNDIKSAMSLIKENEGVLDDFNTMWYKKFRDLFTGKASITSKKQRSALFNMAGFVMAELATPMGFRNES